tara:strand:+ start:322 stop:618 length:297 start_codon:yes stop_codon:yes gene_type:complete
LLEKNRYGKFKKICEECLSNIRKKRKKTKESKPLVVKGIKFEIGFVCEFFKVSRRTEKSLFVIYKGSNKEKRTKIFKDDIFGEYAKYKRNIIMPLTKI